MDLITQRMKLKEAFPNFDTSKYGIDKDKAEFIRKGYTPELKFVEGEKAVISYINTANIDRDSEVTLPEGGMMDDYKQNPVVMFGHDYKELPIGKCEGLKLDDKGWQAKTIYANTDRATEVYEYRRAGFPLAESIGFIPIESIGQGETGFDELAKELAKRGAFKRGDISSIRRIHKKWAMLEYSDVPIPSNPAALQIAIAKGLVLPEIESQIEKELVTKPEETMNMYRIPVDEGNHKDHKIRTIDVSKEKGIKGLYCVDDKKIITYMFDKEKWASMGECQQWVKDHKSFNEEHEISQAEILDEIDYLNLMLDESGHSDKVIDALGKLLKHFPNIDETKIISPKDVIQDTTIPVEKNIEVKEPVKDNPYLPKEYKERLEKELDEAKIKLIREQTVKQVVNNS
jgi:hypothetical protein